MNRSLWGVSLGACLVAAPLLAQQSTDLKKQGLEQQVEFGHAEVEEISARREALLIELEALRLQLEESDARMEGKRQHVDELQRQLDATSE